MHKWSTNLCMPLSCVVHHLVYTAQPWGAHKRKFLFGLTQNGSGALSKRERYTRKIRSELAVAIIMT